MTNSCGMIALVLELASEKECEKRTTFIKTALELAARGTRSLKLFLSEWGVITEEENAKRAALGKVAPLAEVERRSVVQAVPETGGDVVAASRLLRIGKTTLYRKLGEYECGPIPDKVEDDPSQITPK